MRILLFFILVIFTIGVASADYTINGSTSPTWQNTSYNDVTFRYVDSTNVLVKDGRLTDDGDVIHLFNFETGTGTTVYNQISGSNNLTINSASWYSTSTIFNNYSLDSSVYRAYTPGNIVPGIPNNGSIEVWFKPDMEYNSSLAENDHIINWNYVSLSFLATDGRLRAGVNDGSEFRYVYSDNSVWNPDEIYLIAMTWGADNNVTMYVNNTEHDVNENYDGTVGDSSNDFGVGGDRNSDIKLFNGTIDNLRISNISRSTLSMYPTITNVTHWHNAGTDQVTGSFIINATGNINYTVEYGNNASDSWTQIGGYYTANSTPSISGTKYQNTDLRVELCGESTETTELIEVTFVTEAAGAGTVDINITYWNPGSGGLVATYNITNITVEVSSINILLNVTRDTWKYTLTYSNDTEISNQTATYENESLNFSIPLVEDSYNITESSTGAADTLFEYWTGSAWQEGPSYYYLWFDCFWWTSGYPDGVAPNAEQSDSQPTLKVENNGSAAGTTKMKLSENPPATIRVFVDIDNTFNSSDGASEGESIEYNDTNWASLSGTMIEHGDGNLRAPPNVTTNLTSYWSGEAQIGNTLYDVWTANSNDGSFTDGVTGNWTTSGKYGGAMTYDGVNDYINCGNDASLDITEAITIEAWVKRLPGGGDNYQRIVDKDSTNTYGFYVNTAGHLGAGIVTTGVGGNSYDWYENDFNQVITENVWQHVVFTWDSATAKSNVFLNGVVGTELDADGDAIAVTSSNLLIGNRADFARAFYGTIDEVRIYNRALTNDEINESRDNYHNTTSYMETDSPFDAGTGYVNMYVWFNGTDAGSNTSIELQVKQNDTATWETAISDVIMNQRNTIPIWTQYQNVSYRWYSNTTYQPETDIIENVEFMAGTSSLIELTDTYQVVGPSLNAGENTTFWAWVNLTGPTSLWDFDVYAINE